jgi:outer membrane protein OmpA-like peptidoglycan-associated protein
MHPDSIIHVQSLARKNFSRFEYSFIADGTEKYLTFGSFIEEDTTAGKRIFIGTQSIFLILDNFELLPADSNETICNDFIKNKEKIYNYNFRHKEMDYSLFGKGELNIPFDVSDSSYSTRIDKPKENPVKPDTLKLSDVLFDFNKANLKPGAIQMLGKFFTPVSEKQDIDSIYIEGHTDSIGSDARNMQLSQQRCESVELWLLQNDVLNKEGIQIHPFGKTRPVAANNTSQGRAQNRRVEIIIFRRRKK